ncbi:MAG: formate dehydrogenase accessory protein FdhE [Bacillota bacterium]
MSTGPVQLPGELAEFYEGIRNVQQQYLEKTGGSQAFKAPVNWVWDGTSPLINEIMPVFDPAPARELFRQLLKLLAVHKQVWAADTEKLAGITAQDFSVLVAAAMQGDREGMAGVITRLGVKPEVARFALLLTVKPVLRVFAEKAGPYIDKENWMQNYCPVCGNKAGAARVDSTTGRRYLRCAYCQTEWLFRLLCCPSCGNEDHRSLAYIQVEETPGYGLHVCEQCKGYLKVIDEQKGGNRELTANEAATLYLDVIAQQQGYRNDSINT